MKNQIHNLFLLLFLIIPFEPLIAGKEKLENKLSKHTQSSFKIQKKRCFYCSQFLSPHAHWQHNRRAAIIALGSNAARYRARKHPFCIPLKRSGSSS